MADGSNIDNFINQYTPVYTHSLVQKIENKKTKMNNLLHYMCLAEFKKQFYKDVLSFEHLTSGELNIQRVILTTGEAQTEYNFWGYTLEKNNTKYLLPSRDRNNKEIHPINLFPIIPKDTIKIAYRGQAYYVINKPVSVKFQSTQKMSFRKLADFISDTPHSNPLHRKLYTLLIITQMIDRANFRVATPPGFGKDSVVDTLGNLVGNATTIENPTVAKLEFMYGNKLIALNEVVDVSPNDWRLIEQFLLSAGAHKPEITKRSRAMLTGTKEYMDISHLSLLLMYNDKENYPSHVEYFDDFVKDAVKDRFPPLRFTGNFLDNFNNIAYLKIPDYVTEHMQDYKDFLYTFTYFKENYKQHVHNYDLRGKLNSLPQRWQTNLEKYFLFIDLYCETQQEFDTLTSAVLDCITDYQRMCHTKPTMIEVQHKPKRIGKNLGGDLNQWSKKDAETTRPPTQVQQ